jgi:acetylornithine deacetylase
MADRMMNVFELTRKLIDIESVTPNEEAVGLWLLEYLRPLAEQYGGAIEALDVEPHRFNVLVYWGEPVVTLSTHLDTVPPFFPSSEDSGFIWGRGACDVKGIIAAMIKAAEGLLADGHRNFALLFVVGEERNSAGAYAAAQTPRGSRFMINGEPTENRLALGTKGALRFEFHASGKMAHSAYPELGESAIWKLIDALGCLRTMPLETDPLLGASTLNIGTISGGRAPNVIPDHASAELFIRLVDNGHEVRKRVDEVAKGLVEVKHILTIPAVRLGTLPGFETFVAAYTTDIPAFGTAWGKPHLIGPGTIHVAHTSEERIPKDQLAAAVGIYRDLVLRLPKEPS